MFVSVLQNAQPMECADSFAGLAGTGGVKQTAASAQGLPHNEQKKIFYPKIKNYFL